MKLRAPGKAVVLKTVPPNLGVEATYRRRLDRLVEAMNKSILYWVIVEYRANPPAMAMDATPATALRAVMAKLARRWTREFNEAATPIADAFATESKDVADATMKKILKDVGFSVTFQQTPAMRDALSSVVGENVALIKSIPSKHFANIEGAVMRSVQAGRDLKTLRDELLEMGDITKNRAAMIARDQNNKATAVMSKARRLSLGLNQAKWVHSGGGVHPRKSHVAANGKIYDVEKGCLIDGEYIMPGEKINCRCQSRAIIPGFED